MTTCQEKAVKVTLYLVFAILFVQLKTSLFCFVLHLAVISVPTACLLLGHSDGFNYYWQGLSESRGVLCWFFLFCPPGDVVAQELAGDRRSWWHFSSDGPFQAPAPVPWCLIVCFQMITWMNFYFVSLKFLNFGPFLMAAFSYS